MAQQAHKKNEQEALKALIEKGRREKQLDESEVLGLFEDPDSAEARALLEELEDESGTVKLSKRKADRIRGWERILECKAEGDVVEGVCMRKIKGGLLVDIGVPVFLPASQVDIRRPGDIGEFIGKTVRATILKIDEERRNIVISRRKLIEVEREDAKKALLARWPVRARAPQRLWFEEDGLCLTVLTGEAETILSAMADERFDAWFLDGFAPARNPAMWSPELLRHVGRLSAPGARLATFTVAGEVRRGLEAAGFAVEKKPGFGGKRERLVVQFRLGMAFGAVGDLTEPRDQSECLGAQRKLPANQPSRLAGAVHTLVMRADEVRNLRRATGDTGQERSADRRMLL